MESCQLQMQLPFASHARTSELCRKILRLAPHAQDSEPIPKGCFTEAQELGCLALISSRPVQRVLDELPLHRGERLVQRRVPQRFDSEELGGGLRGRSFGKVLGHEQRLEDRSVAHDEQSLDVVLELADVSWPGVLSQNREQARRDLRCRTPDALAIILDEVPGKDGDVSPSFAQWRE